jgi:hypothetical protein
MCKASFKKTERKLTSIKMRINIIGVGESARHWKGEGPSIGVNDVIRFGYQPTYLLVLNTPNKFSTERLNHIKQIRSQKVFTDYPNTWADFLTVPIEEVKSRLYNANEKKPERLSRNYIYHARTSPFVAISLAYAWGYNEIILYGVDFKTHKTYTEGTRAFNQEFERYRIFCDSLRKEGVSVYRISDESALTFLPIWQG